MYCSTWTHSVFFQHHCRACGQIFCGKCSSKYSTIPKFGIEKEVRVCEPCFELLNKWVHWRAWSMVVQECTTISVPSSVFRLVIFTGWLFTSVFNDSKFDPVFTKICNNIWDTEVNAIYARICYKWTLLKSTTLTFKCICNKNVNFY